MKPLRRDLSVAALGLEMGGCVAVGYLLGTWVDGTFGSDPYGLVFFLVAGAGAAFKGLWHATQATREVMRGTAGEREA